MMKKNVAATKLPADVGSPTGLYNGTPPNELIFHFCHAFSKTVHLPVRAYSLCCETQKEVDM